MTALFTLQCPSCGGKTRVAPGGASFICDYCGNSHIIQLTNLRRDPYPYQAEIPQRRRIIPRPREVKVEKQGQKLVLSWRWFTPKTIGLAIFCVFWDAFLCFWYSLAFSMESVPWLMIVFPVGHLAIGIGLSYAVLASFLNTTTLRIDERSLIVQHDPVPWPGEINTPVSELAQLYVKMKHNRHRNQDSESYQLCAILKNGRKLDLASDLSSSDLAIFLEQEIETCLKITNERVAGEMML